MLRLESLVVNLPENYFISRVAAINDAGEIAAVIRNVHVTPQQWVAVLLTPVE